MSTTATTSRQDTQPPPSETVPRPAPGIELIGEYQGSGFKQPPYIARRSDGQVVQMPRLLYLVAEAVDGVRDYAAIGNSVTEQVGRVLDADGARLLVEEKLRPIGVVAQADGSVPELHKSDPLLALKMKTSVVPEEVVRAVSRCFKPLFFPPVVLTMLGGFIALDVWLFVFHGVAQSLRQTLYDPLFILLLLALVAASAAFHECGHATACAYGGARPGVMGVGIYIVWPAFYTDVTDAYRLGKGGRLRTDLGGVYFNSIFSLATFGVYFLTRWEPLLLVVPLQIMEMLHQFLPFIRLDGYYIVSDLTGVPDMFSRIKPTLKSLNPVDATPAEVKALKPWVRFVVTVYVFTVVPLLLFLLALTVINAPRIVGTAWDSLVLQNHHLHEHVATHAYLHVAVDAIQMGILVLPVAGLFAMFWKLGKTLVTGAWARTEGRRLARMLLVAASAVGAAFAAYTWLPGAGYTPIAQAERGTIGSGIRGFAHESQPRFPLFDGRRHAPPPGSPRSVEPTTTPGQQGVSTTVGTSSGAGTAPVSTTQASTPPATTARVTGTAPATTTTKSSSPTSTPPAPNSITTQPAQTIATSTTNEQTPTSPPQPTTQPPTTTSAQAPATTTQPTTQPPTTTSAQAPATTTQPTTQPATTTEPTTTRANTTTTTP